MVIDTKDLGSVEIGEKDIIKFPHGIFGFKDCRRFVLLSDKNKDNPFLWLQYVDSREPRFVVVDPLRVFKGYVVPASAARPLIDCSESDMRLLAITTVTAGADKVYVNLKCPIVINARDNTAAQIILDSEDYPLRYYILKRGA